MIKSSGHAAALTPKGSTATEVKQVVLHQKFWTFPGSLSLTIICWYTDRKQALLTNMLCYCTQARNSFAEGRLPLKLTFEGDDILLVKRSSALGTDGLKVYVHAIVATLEAVALFPCQLELGLFVSVTSGGTRKLS